MSAVTVTLTLSARELFEIKQGIRLRIKQLEEWAKIPAGPLDAQEMARELEDCKAALAKAEAA
jgi:hypothetical protein